MHKKLQQLAQRGQRFLRTEATYVRHFLSQGIQTESDRAFWAVTACVVLWILLAPNQSRASAETALPSLPVTTTEQSY